MQPPFPVLGGLWLFQPHRPNGMDQDSRPPRKWPLPSPPGGAARSTPPKNVWVSPGCAGRSGSGWGGGFPLATISWVVAFPPSLGWGSPKDEHMLTTKKSVPFLDLIGGIRYFLGSDPDDGHFGGPPWSHFDSEWAQYWWFHPITWDVHTTSIAIRLEISSVELQSFPDGLVVVLPPFLMVNHRWFNQICFWICLMLAANMFEGFLHFWWVFIQKIGWWRLLPLCWVPLVLNVTRNEAWTAASPTAGSRASWNMRKRPREPSTSACRCRSPGHLRSPGLPFGKLT